MESVTQAVHTTGGQDETSERPAAVAAPEGTVSLAEEIAALWAEILHAPQAGVEDDFFRLGGNSLSGIKIIERVEQDHGVQLSVRDFYLAQTPARVAELIERGRAEV